VEFVEHRLEIATTQERTAQVLPYIQRFRTQKVDALVLGCTHFLLLKQDFIEAGTPDMKIFDSVEGVTKQIERLVTNGQHRIAKPAYQTHARN
jgi:glutamate racemase